MKKWLTKAFIALFAVGLLIPSLTNQAYAADTTIRLYVNFETNTLSQTEIPIQYSASPTKNLSMDASSYVPGIITNAILVNNGQNFTVTWNGTTLQVNGVTGNTKPVYGKSETKPGHQIYRQPDGNIWEHKGEKTSAIEFDGTTGSTSPYPGLIPTQGRYRYTTDPFDYRTPGDPNNGPDLRYAYDSSQYSLSGQTGQNGNPAKPASGDIVKDFGKEGWAVTTAYGVIRPDFWYFNEPDANINGNAANISDGNKINPSSIEIYGAEQHPSTDAIPLSYGVGTNPGQGMIRTMLKLDDTVTVGTFKDTPGTAPYGLLRNYYMYAIAKWKGETYSFQAYFDVTYKPADQPDLTFQYIQADKACIQVGDTVNIKYGYKDIGLSTTTPFNVQLKVDGTTIHTDNVAGGASKDILLDGTTPYTFTSTAPKSFTLVVDPSDAVGDANRANNTDSVIFQALNSCSGGGGPEVITGTLTVDKPTINYGDSNTIRMLDVSVSGGNNCALSTGIMIYTQNSYSKAYTLNYTGNFTNAFVASPYNGFSVGSVSVQYEITTTCGTKKVIGPGSFEVIGNQGNANPQFEASWFEEDYYTGGYGVKTTMVPIGETISLGHVTRPAIQALGDNGTPYDPDGDSLIYFWNFDGSSSPWIRWLGDDNVGRGFYPFQESFSNIKATELGSHTVQVTAFDGRGGHAGPYNVTLNVVDANPVPVITLPPKVIEGRPYTPDISCANSWSPYKNRSIASCDWHGTKQSVYPTAGNYEIKLDVTDSTGLTSKIPAIQTLTVQPDLPPVVDASLPSKGIRGTKMNMQDVSFSPDGDQIVKHTAQIIMDTNFNGNFSDDPVQNMVLDSSGNFSYTPSVLANGILRIYVQEDWGKSATKDFPFSIANQMPTVAIDVKGEVPLPPVVEGISYDMQDMAVNTGRYVVEDHYDSSRFLGMYYNSTEQALASPSRQYDLYRAPVADGFTYSETGYSSNSNPLYSRGMLNTWYTGGADWTCGGYMYCIPSGIMLSIFNDLSNSTVKFERHNYGDYIQMNVNPLADLVWLRTSKSANSSTGTGNYDELFKLSELAKGNFTPFQKTYFTITSWHYMSQYQFTQIPENPPPNGWVPAESVPPKTDSVPYNFDVYGVQSLKDKTVTQKRDNQGNSYAFKCSSYQIQSGWDDNGNPYMVTVYNCNLQKISPQGTVLWTGTKLYTNRSGGTPYLDIVYITTDNSRIVLSDGIYDNNTGAYLGQIPGFDYSGYSGFSQYGYPQGYGNLSISNIYKDVIYYNTRASLDPTCDSSCSSGEIHHLYNIRTGQEILNLKGPVISSDGTGARFETTISSNGKLVMPYRNGDYYSESHGYKPKIRVYDMITGQLEFESALLNNFWTPNTCYDGSYFYCPGNLKIKLTGDTEGYLIWNDNNYNNYSLRKIKWNTPNGIDAGIYSNGSIIDKTQSISDASLSASIKFVDTTFSELNGAGITFRSQDHRNYYQAELTTRGIVLNKVVNGVRTILDKQTNPITAGEYNNLKVSVKGNRIIVYVNGVPLIHVTDNTFTTGKVGVFANAPNLYIKKFYVEKAIGSTNLVDNVAIVNSTIIYNVDFKDPDNDPPIPELGKWTYTNLEPQKFLKAGDGYSDTNASNSYVNFTSSSPVLKINKVGLFKISFTEPDDPAPIGKRYPDSTYASFRNYADPDTKQVIVHRRPISLFTLSVNPDKSVAWTDSSYDPDRWLNAWTYSTEATGINYAANRGILEYKRNYTTPSGVTVDGQISRPAEWGWYTVRQAVMDEYGAWSDWYEVTFWMEPAPNNPPGVALVFPSGSNANPTPVSIQPTISWNQWDPQPNTTFSTFNLSIRDEWGGCVECISDQAMYTKNPSWAWTMDNLLMMGQKYQVQVQVSDDGGLWSPWSNIGWMATNSPPAAAMSFPWGTQAAPTSVNTLRPTLSWTQTDPDPGTLYQYFQIQITNEANDVMILDSGKQWLNTTATTASWLVNADLPAGKKLRVRVKVWDQYGAESPWSEQAWMLINRAPTGQLTFATPIYEHDTPQFTVTASDPDGDALSILIESRFGSSGYQPLIQWASEPSGQGKAFTHGPLAEGTYTFRLTLNDGKGGVFQQEYSFVVLPLQITGAVTHTAEWESYRLKWNDNHPTKLRAPDVFWSGEAFELSATMTDTGSSPTKPVEVTSLLVETGELTTLTADIPGSSRYIGQLINTEHSIMLSNGPYTFRFTVHWSNGLVQTVDVPVRIQGDLRDVIVVQIRH